MWLTMTALSVVAALCTQVGAKTGVPIQIGAAVGLANPVGPDDFDKAVNSGLDLAVGANARLAPRFRVGAVLSLANPRLDEDEFLPELIESLVLQGMPREQASEARINVDGGELRILSLSGELKLDLMQAVAVSPYVMAGGGIARLSLGDATTTTQVPDELPDVRMGEGTTETKGLITFGGGIEAAAWIKVSIFARCGTSEPSPMSIQPAIPSLAPG